MIMTVHVGLGPIGAAIARLALTKPWLTVAGAVDIDPDLVGQDLGAVLGQEPIGVRVVETIGEALASTPTVVVHCTGSFLVEVQGQIEECLRAGVNVVSTCEELAFPYCRHPKRSRTLDALARAHGVTVLATGVNPGFAMDTLPLLLTAACRTVEHVHVTRVLDAGQRRRPFQVKVGAGLSVAEFDAKVQSGRFGHIGLRESLEMVAASLGWPIDRVEDRLEPVVATRDHATAFLEVRAGRVAGIRQCMVGFAGDRERIRLDLEMSVGAANPRDEVRLEGGPPLQMVVPGGFHGDIVTAAVVVNAIPRVVAARPGLLTMRDLPLVHLATRADMKAGVPGLSGEPGMDQTPRREGGRSGVGGGVSES